MADTPNPLIPSTTVTDGDWTVDSNSVAFPTTEAEIREAMADSSAMPAIQVNDNGDEVSGPGSPGSKLKSLQQAASVDAFAAAAAAAPAAPAPAPANDAQDDDEDDGEDAAAKDPAPAPAKTEEKKPSKASRHAARIAEINARIAERTRARHEAERAAAAPPPPPRPAEPAAPPPPAPRPAARAPLAEDSRPEWSQFDADGKDYKEFEAADRAWQARHDAAIIARAEEAAAAKAREARESVEHDQRVRAAKAAHPDFEEKRAALTGIDTTPFLTAMIQQHPSGMDVLYHLGANREDAELLSVLTHPDNDPRGVLPHLFHSIMDAGDDPVPVLSFLTSHPEEAQALLDLPPRAALIQIGKLLAGAGAKTSGPPTPPARKPPAPFTPVDGGSSMRSRADDDPEPSDDASDDEWFDWRQRQQARERRAARG